MTTCNEENMRTFIAALRSGEYTQGRNLLRQTFDEGVAPPTPRYCCLGVATDMYLKATPALNYEGNWQAFNTFNIDLPREVREWLGVDAPNPLLDCGDGQKINAITLNDGLKVSFEYIADAFENTYLPGDSDVDL